LLVLAGRKIIDMGHQALNRRRYREAEERVRAWQTEQNRVFQALHDDIIHARHRIQPRENFDEISDPRDIEPILCTTIETDRNIELRQELQRHVEPQTMQSLSERDALLRQHEQQVERLLIFMNRRSSQGLVIPF
jgi:hypothetical protein